jgi:hypothetical protein
MRLFLVIPALLLSAQTYSQGVVETDASVLNLAKLSAQNRLTLLRDTLSLTRRESRIRNFSLDKCEPKESVAESKSWTPKGEFVFRTDCPGIYTYRHKTDNNRSHYDITFFFDSSGLLKHTNISWFLVVH